MLMNGWSECAAFIQWNITQPLNNEIIKFAAKWMDVTRKSYPEWSNPDLERQILCMLAYMWVLAVKSKLTKL